MSTIVVGVDGSPDSRAALRWALDEARLRHAEVVVLYAFEMPPSGWPGLSELVGVLREEGQRHLNAVIEEVAGPDDGGVSIRRELVAEPAARALLAAAQGADLLIVGSRGLGGFRGLLLGSVSLQCVSHAACPVVVVRQPR